MRLIGLTMVRDEIDVIDAWLDHHSQLLDALIVVCHESADGTQERVVERARSGGALMALSVSGPDFRQGHTLTQVLRTQARSLGSGWVFALDADEFIVSTTRTALEMELQQLPHGAAALLRWQTYVPVEDSSGGVLSRFRLRVDTEPDYQAKVAFPAALFESPERVLLDGNHGIADLYKDDLRLGLHVPLCNAWLAHIPIRSERQFVHKVLQGNAAVQRMRAGRGRMAWHWGDLAQRITAGESFDLAELRDIAVRYYAFGSAIGPCETLPVVQFLDDPILPERAARRA